jgi:hypothetical protein
VAVPYGSGIQVMVVSDHVGFKVEWDVEGRPELRSMDPIFKRSVVDRDFEIVAVFIADAESLLLLYLALIFLAFGLTILFLLLLWRRPKVHGVVLKNGEPVAKARIGYTVNDRSGFAKTNKNGEYVIHVSVGAGFMITSLTKDGEVIDGDAPVDFEIERRVTEHNILIK